MNLSIFKPPQAAADYSFWRVWHQQRALVVILAAAAFAVGRWLV